MTLHEELKQLFQKSAEIDAILIEKLQEAQRVRLFERFGYSSLFQYVISQFNVSESKAYLLINTSRKCTEVPQLKEAIVSGKLSVSKAKPILSVVEENPELWIEKATKLSKDQIERAVACQNPESKIQERVKPIAEDLFEFKCGISHEDEKLIKRCREIASQNLHRNASWSETLRIMANDSLDKRDPVRRAERSEARKHQTSAQLSPGRVLINVRKKLSAEREHQVFLRDQGRCRDKKPDGKPCGQSQWTEIHHIKPVAMGGTDDLDNLITLCSFHHKKRHNFESKKYAKKNISEYLAIYSISDYLQREQSYRVAL